MGVLPGDLRKQSERDIRALQSYLESLARRAKSKT
jgi:hypothetical protein